MSGLQTCLYRLRKHRLSIREGPLRGFMSTYAGYLEAYLILSAVALWWRITFHTVAIRACLSRCGSNQIEQPQDPRGYCSTKKVGQEIFIIFCWPLLLVLWVAAVFVTAGFFTMRFFDDIARGTRSRPGGHGEGGTDADGEDLEKGKVDECMWQRRGWLVMLRAGSGRAPKSRYPERSKGSASRLVESGSFKVVLKRPISKAALQRLVGIVVSLHEDGIFREIINWL